MEIVKTGHLPGNGTLGMKLAEHYDFLHIVTADLIREEISTRTERAFRLARLMSQGQLVPTDILVELMITKILNNRLNKHGVVVSGFPRRKEQSILFDRFVRPPHLVLYLDVRDSVLSDRIMGRSITTREVVVMNYEDIKNQLKEFHTRTRPIVKHYKDCLVQIDGEADLVSVFETACEAVDRFLQKLDTSSSVTSR
ncbi:adenylate kinase isoenzyme 1-like [Megalopta genalis]|uniref:adenylate kinase isoenzyme 1-like n=1 Tax=Megalopta genalis TaxID=115081 RepID=UPI003FD56D7B